MALVGRPARMEHARAQALGPHSVRMEQTGMAQALEELRQHPPPLPTHLAPWAAGLQAARGVSSTTPLPSSQGFDYL